MPRVLDVPESGGLLLVTGTCNDVAQPSCGPPHSADPPHAHCCGSHLTWFSVLLRGRSECKGLLHAGEPAWCNLDPAGAGLVSACCSDVVVARSGGQRQAPPHGKHQPEHQPRSVFAACRARGVGPGGLSVMAAQIAGVVLPADSIPASQGALMHEMHC